MIISPKLLSGISDFLHSETVRSHVCCAWQGLPQVFIAALASWPDFYAIGGCCADWGHNFSLCAFCWQQKHVTGLPHRHVSRLWFVSPQKIIRWRGWPAGPAVTRAWRRPVGGSAGSWVSRLYFSGYRTLRKIIFQRLYPVIWEHRINVDSILGQWNKIPFQCLRWQLVNTCNYMQCTQSTEIAKEHAI